LAASDARGESARQSLDRDVIVVAPSLPLDAALDSQPDVVAARACKRELCAISELLKSHVEVQLEPVCRRWKSDRGQGRRCARRRDHERPAPGRPTANRTHNRAGRDREGAVRVAGENRIPIHGATRRSASSRARAAIHARRAATRAAADASTLPGPEPTTSSRARSAERTRSSAARSASAISRLPNG